jgi:UDP-N-acetylmuramate dehydrogenase
VTGWREGGEGTGRREGGRGRSAGAPGTARLAAAVAARLGPAVAPDAPLGALTTYRVGGTAALMVRASSEKELLHVREALADAGAAGILPVLVLGKGSNLLVADAGFPGLVVRLAGPLAEIEVPEHPVDGETTVWAGGGADLPVLARKAVTAGLTGLEWAVGIPGTVGGALKMNAGGHGSDTASCLSRYCFVDLAGEGGGEAGPERLGLGYRTSSLRESEVVVWARFRVRAGDPSAGQATLREIVRWRHEHQPGGSNAGSVFTNPPGDSAGRLVEEAGLKGFRLGSARVSEKHANFIQADDGGSADDVLALMAHVQRVVAERCGVALRPEVKLVGFGEAGGHVLEGEGEGAGGNRTVAPGAVPGGSGSVA